MKAGSDVGLDELRQRVALELSKIKVEVTLDVPYHRGDVVARVHQDGDVLDVRAKITCVAAELVPNRKHLVAFWAAPRTATIVAATLETKRNGLTAIDTFAQLSQAATSDLKPPIEEFAITAAKWIDSIFGPLVDVLLN